MIDIFRNPIIIGLLAGVLTYIYMWWINEKNYKNDPEAKKTTGIITPLVVTIVTCVLSYGYYEMSENSGTVLPIHDNINPVNNNEFKFGKDMPTAPSESAKEFHLISKGLNIPNNLKLPDVFIETM